MYGGQTPNSRKSPRSDGMVTAAPSRCASAERSAGPRPPLPSDRLCDGSVGILKGYRKLTGPEQPRPDLFVECGGTMQRAADSLLRIQDADATSQRIADNL